ncbi:tRNA (guanine(46)-N(7))-methyltransferase TrmB [Rhodobacter maris]|uniref:tRNA (guanine-N(7)-)-methyltransferase n=1 Tax=Rhodobacter maris TaxID=446682 RepID=A0A285RG76_9RHOB|nr:tRNA (guanine(46)-N(7))-methyltransferase TrmB [Rhodobacter maris]SOB92669.1 tRNA (guanine-N(7)-)-methyltransferase [Rhodobacter maris]
MSESSEPQSPDPAVASSEAAPEWRNFYGRRSGKTMRPSQKTYLSEDLASLTPQGISKEENPGREVIDPGTIFGNDAPFWLEVGFGGGEHMVHMAARYPGINILGCEPFINGVAMLLGKIRAAGVANVAIWPGDARDVMEVLPEGSVAKAFLNYPDPWPKRRHNRRRFVTQDHLLPLHRILAPGAEFRVATDIPDYMKQALREAPKAGFALTAHSPAPWEDWISTRYEQKALREGRTPDYATFRRA